MTLSPTHPLHHEASEKLFERSRAVIPGGVNSPVRAFNSVGGTPAFAAKAKGPYLYDADGVEYLDMLAGFGVFALGRHHPVVRQALHDVLDLDLADLTQFDAISPNLDLIVDAAEELQRAIFAPARPVSATKHPNPIATERVRDEPRRCVHGATEISPRDTGRLDVDLTDRTRWNRP